MFSSLSPLLDPGSGNVLMGKRKNREGPPKLTDFFSPAGARDFQDGAGSSVMAPRHGEAATAAIRGMQRHIAGSKDRALALLHPQAQLSRRLGWRLKPTM